MMRFGARILMLALTMTLVVACGDDNGDGKRAVKKEDFIAQADAICKASDDATTALYQDVHTEDFEVLRPLIDRTADILLQAVADIEELGEPDRDAEEMSRVLAEAKTTVRHFKDLETKAELETSSAQLAAVNRRVAKLGFKVCGKSRE